MTFQNPFNNRILYVYDSLFIYNYMQFSRKTLKMFFVLFLPEEVPFSVTQEGPVIPD